MYAISKKRSNPKIQSEIVSGLIGGLNTFQDENLIKESELTEAKNIILDIDGISPRPGTIDYGNDDNSTKKLGGIGYYNSDGTREFLTVGNDGRLRKLSGVSWSNIGSKVYSTTQNVEFVQARDKIYIFNGEDELSYYDGSSITVYTALTTPSAPTVSPQGTTGSTTYSYRVSAFNSVGETLASTTTATTTGTVTLSNSNYNQISWSDVSGATGYNVWGREATGLAETYLDTVYTTTYDDKGQNDPSTTLIPPEANTTEGIVCSMAVFAISRIFAAGDPDHPSRLYYGGVGTNIGNFSGSLEGGGYVDVFRNDGSQIRSILPFQGGVIVWKDNAIYKFSFTSVVLNNTQVSVPQLEEVTRSFGGISFRSCRHVENDIIFAAKKDGRLAFYSLGNQENYASTVLRTNELSIKIREKLDDVAVNLLPESASFYFNDLYGCAVAKANSTVKDRVWILDTRFGSWVYWEGFNPNFFMTYEDSTGSVKQYFGTENDGFMTQMFYSTRSDNGSAIAVNFSTKSFNQKLFNKFKRFFNPTFQFKDVTISGALSGEIIVDGTISQGTFTINQQVVGGAGVGADLVGFTLPGEAGAGVELSDSVSSDIVTEAYMSAIGRAIKYSFTSSAVNFNYKLLSFAHTYQLITQRRLDENQRFYVN